MRTHGIWIGVATLGIIICTSVTLGVIAYRKFQKEKQQTVVEANASRDAKREEPPGKATGTSPIKSGTKSTDVSSGGKDKPPAEKAATPSPKVSETAASDPEFERVWAACLKTAQFCYNHRANAAANSLAVLSGVDLAEAKDIMAKVDTDPYGVLPSKIEHLHHYDLTNWAIYTGAWKALQDPEFKLFAAGVWHRSLTSDELLVIASLFCQLKAEDRTAVVEAIRTKKSAKDLSPHIRFTITDVGAEKWLGPRTFDQIWDELRAESDQLMDSQAGLTAYILKQLPPDAQRFTADIMRRVEANPSLLPESEGQALVFQMNLSLWHEARRARAAVADPGFKRMAKILWDTGVGWDGLSKMTRQFYWENAAMRARVIAAVTDNSPSRAIKSDIRKWLADHGGKKWIERR